MAKATGLIFVVQRRFSLRGAFCHAAVHAMHSSWTYQGLPLYPIHLLLTTKDVDFVVGM